MYEHKNQRNYIIEGIVMIGQDEPQIINLFLRVLILVKNKYSRKLINAIY